MDEFHSKLTAEGIGAKGWPNTWTEVEHLGNGKFAASIGVGHRVFFDKADGNKPKKHKLTDERPAKDYVLIQGPKCCVEVYPYYAKYFDVNHEEVRLYEERWVVQRLFKAPDEWRDVDAYNPVMELKEEGGRISVTVTYQTDYGTLLVRYSQGDGNNLAHHVLFVNESGGTETFRVLRRWAGIVGGKCNGKEIPFDIDTPEEASYLTFHSTDKPQRKFNIRSGLRGMLYKTVYEKTGRIIEVVDPRTGVVTEVEETRSVKQLRTEECLKLPIRVETHAQGMKADFAFERWTLTPTEVLTIGSPYALDFDGDDYVESAANIGISGGAARSFEAWVKSDREPLTENFLMHWGVGADNNLFALLAYNDGKWGVDGFGATNAWHSEHDLDTGWHYICVTYDGSHVEFYIDNIRSGAGWDHTFNTTDTPLTIGYVLNWAGWDGIIDEVRISDIARTPEEIEANWNNGSGKKLEADEHTVALYHMDEGEGGIIHDESLNGNDGTIYGASWIDGFPFGEDCPDSATLDDPTVDGYAGRTETNVSWDSLHDGAGNEAGYLAIFVRVCVEYAALGWYSIYRGLILFDTSFLEGATLTSAKLSVYGKEVTDDFTSALNVYSSNPASTTALENADYVTLGTTPFSTEIASGSWSTTGYNDFLLNAAGLAAISLTGVSKFGLRESNYDAPDSEPPGPGVGDVVQFDFHTEEEGAGYGPTLYVEYTPPAVAAAGGSMAAKMMAAGVL